MTRCARAQHLEAVALGEAPLSVDADVRSHVKQCASCRHELRWLETESTLFHQRASRDEVATLWSGVAERRGLAEAPWRWSRAVMALAATVALMVGLGQLTAPRSAGSSAAAEPLESDALMSPALFLDDPTPCSRLPSGMGFSCSQPVPASFLASRD